MRWFFCQGYSEPEAGSDLAALSMAAIGHYFKRLTALQYEFGSTDHHVTRYAELTRR